MSIPKNNKIISSLYEAYDRSEGSFSGIPECCIEVYISGRIYHDFKLSLDASGRKKLNKFEYVPCDECFKNDNFKKIKKNGISHRGRMIRTLIETFKKD